MFLSDFFQGLKEVVHPNYHTKNITSSDVERWPFTVDQVTIAKQGDHYLYVTIEGEEYALNGITSDHMNYRPVSGSEYLKPKGIGHESVGPIIRVAEALGE